MSRRLSVIDLGKQAAYNVQVFHAVKQAENSKIQTIGKILNYGQKQVRRLAGYGIGGLAGGGDIGQAGLKAYDPVKYDQDFYSGFYTTPEQLKNYYYNNKDFNFIKDVFTGQEVISPEQFSGELKNDLNNVTPQHWQSLFDKTVQNKRKENLGKLYKTVWDSDKDNTLNFTNWGLRLGKAYGFGTLPGLNPKTTKTYFELADKLQNNKSTSVLGSLARGGAKPLAVAGSLTPKAVALTSSAAPDLLLNVAESSAKANEATGSIAEAANMLKKTTENVNDVAKDVGTGLTGMTNKGLESASDIANASKAINTGAEAFTKGTESVNKLIDMVSQTEKKVQNSAQLQSLADAADSFGSFMKQMQMYAPAIAAGVGLTGMYALYHRLTASKKKKTKQASTIQSLAKQAAWVSY